MKLFWKFFCASVLTASVLFAVGGYMLIDKFFESTLGSALESACGENAIIASSLEKSSDSVFSDTGTVRSAIDNLTLNGDVSTTLVRISDTTFSTVYSSLSVWFDTNMLAELEPEQICYRVIRHDEDYYVRVVREVYIGRQRYYLESFSNISAAFSQRNSELRYYMILTLFLVAADAVVMFLLSQRMTRPITRMRMAASDLAAGKTGIRVSPPKRADQDEVNNLVTDFNRMAESLDENIAELKDAAKRQEDFIGSFAHELKTPLTSMIGYADMLRSHELNEEQTLVSANYIFQEGKRLEALSHKMMDLIVVRNHAIQKKRIRTSALFESVVSVCYPSIHNDSSQLSVVCDDAIVTVEPDLMKTVLINLIDNARKALEENGIIWLSGHLENDCFVIAIKDNGRGIPPQDLARITEAFYMVDKSRSRAKGGAGLGLAVCAEICQLHNTALEYESQVGIGTTVTLRLRPAEPLPEETEEDE